MKRHKAPEKHFRQGLSVSQFFAKFPNDKAAEAWVAKKRWPDEVCCPRCGSVNVQTQTKHRTMPYRCREKECGKWFSVKTGDAHGLLQTWVPELALCHRCRLDSPEGCLQYETAS